LRAQFGGAALPEGGIEAHAANVMRQVLGQTPAQVGQVQRTTTNGLATAALPARAQAQSSQVVDVSVVAYRVDQRAYHFITVAPAGGAAPFSSMLRSMRTISNQEAAALRARRIDVVSVNANDTAQTLARRMAFDDYQWDRFLALNGRDANQPVRAGELVKVVSYAP
jgi:predicted Zn-dependent protease